MELLIFIVPIVIIPYIIYRRKQYLDYMSDTNLRIWHLERKVYGLEQDTKRGTK